VTQQEELNRRKNDMLDVLGHDLRSPLGAIKMNFEILAETTKLNTEGTEQQKKFLANCQSSIARMNRLIEKILDMRQLETGKIVLKYDTVETNALLEQGVAAQGQWAKDKNISLKVNAPALPAIEADSDRIYQVITNLVSNALKFTPEGGSITAEGKTVTNNGVECVEIAVKDSGLGIDKKDFGKIFDKYAQVTANAQQGVRGLGLGLSICKAIIDLHGGKIWVESGLGKGSTFTFQVPVKQKAEK
jgi:NtrC-family two-component system sensor histidine kinase KinB